MAGSFRSPGSGSAGPCPPSPAEALRAALSAAGLPFGGAREVAVAGTSPWARRLGRAAVGAGAPTDLRRGVAPAEAHLFGAHLLAVWDPRLPAPCDPAVVVARALGSRWTRDRLAAFVTVTAAWIRSNGRWRAQRLDPSDLGPALAPAAGGPRGRGPHRLRRFRNPGPACGEPPIDVVPWVD